MIVSIFAVEFLFVAFLMLNLMGWWFDVTFRMNNFPAYVTGQLLIMGTAGFFLLWSAKWLGLVGD